MTRILCGESDVHLRNGVTIIGCEYQQPSDDVTKWNFLSSVYRIQIAPRSDLYTDGLRSTVYAIRNTHTWKDFHQFTINLIETQYGIRNTDNAIRVHGKLALITNDPPGLWSGNDYFETQV